MGRWVLEDDEAGVGRRQLKQLVGWFPACAWSRYQVPTRPQTRLSTRPSTMLIAGQHVVVPLEGRESLHAFLMATLPGNSVFI